MGSENRKYLRIASLNLLHVEVLKENSLIRQGPGRTLNISESGMLIEIHFSIEPDDAVLISIGLKDDLLEIKGKSVRCLPAENGKYRIGILFEKIADGATEKVLKKYIEAFNEGKSDAYPAG